METTAQTTQYTFFSDSIAFARVETKSGESFYIEGYISTGEKDLYNDVITRAAMEDMVAQLKSKKVKLDVEHESWRGGSPNIVPIGMIEDARLDAKGVWVKAKLNSHSGRFTEVWSSIKDGFLDAFSIAYKATKAVKKNINGVVVRVLDGLELLNVALTGNPVNPECRMTSVFTKSLTEFPEDPEAPQGEPEMPPPPLEEEKEPEETPMAEEVAQPPVEEKSNPVPIESPAAPAVDVVAELKSRDDRIAILEAELKNNAAQIAALREIVEKPQLKARVEEATTAQPAKKVLPLDII